MIKKIKKSNYKPKLTAQKRFKRPFLVTFLITFTVFGILFIFYTFAGSRMQIFRDNVDYWRPRIAGCESGSGPVSKPNYQASNGTHFGAYQFDAGTWRSNVSPEVSAQYPTALTAPPDIQDQAFNNTFAKRGTQPWIASYYCWIRGANPGPIAPPAPPKGAYNVSISGRVFVNNHPAENVSLITCEKNQPVTTDANGIFSLTVVSGKIFCLRPFKGLPANAVLDQSRNNPERARFVSYESQLAGIGAYHNLNFFNTVYWEADRDSDDGYDFYYSTP